MITTAILVGFAIMVAVVFFFVVRTRRPGQSSYPELIAQLEPIHLPALNNLLDPSQSTFLRSRLSPKEFAKVQRKRNRAAIVYVKRILRNTEILIACADFASHSENPTVATSGRELLNLASQTRIRALYSLVLLYTSLQFPGLTASLQPTVSGYSEAHRHSEALTELVGP